MQLGLSEICARGKLGGPAGSTVQASIPRRRRISSESFTTKHQVCTTVTCSTGKRDLSTCPRGASLINSGSWRPLCSQMRVTRSTRRSTKITSFRRYTDALIHVPSRAIVKVEKSMAQMMFPCHILNKTSSARVCSNVCTFVEVQHLSLSRRF